jgi:SAM-dependent methyltransferase
MATIATHGVGSGGLPGRRVRRCPPDGFAPAEALCSLASEPTKGAAVIGLGKLDNDLAGWLDRTLVVPGILGPEHFEEAFVAIVTSAAPDPEDAWLAFYRNTLAALHGAPEPGGTNAEIKPVHERAAQLAVGDVLELGCCFGFLALRLAAAGHRVIAGDLTAGTVDLLARTAPRLGLTVDTLLADARAVPLPDGAVDTVLAVHLIEHLPAEEGKVVLAEAIRLARRRVVVAVPFEDAPNETWGHVTTFDRASLTELGAETGLDFTVSEHHGGWLVVDR